MKKGEGERMLKEKTKKITIILVMVLSLFGLNTINNYQIVEAQDQGTNDATMNALIANVVNGSSNLGNDAFIARWQAFSWKMDSGVEDAWKWNNRAQIEPDIANTIENNPDVKLNVASNPTNTIKVYSAKQLAEALTNPGLLVGKTISIEKDLDFAGYEYAWTTSSKLVNVTIQGNSHTIYNIGGSKSFISDFDGSTMSDIVFDSAKLVTSDVQKLGIIGNFAEKNYAYDANVLNNVRIQNSMFFSSQPATFDNYVGPLGESKGLSADYIATVNNIVYATTAHVGGLIALSDNTKITNSYSVESLVVAGGNHSGGFVSCSNGGIIAENSFTNNEVYGNSETGVFIGSLMENAPSSSPNKGASFMDCYTSGSIEGTVRLGGFIGTIDPASPSDSGFVSKFERCYSTSIVGMKSGGSELGGFIGGIKRKSATPVQFIDSFAAGEVGSIDTNLNTTSGTVGGFIGNYGTPTLPMDARAVFSNTYYDKQTTAMRELESGQTKDKVNDSDASIGIAGLKGVLTSDSTKFGAGLASQPKEASGAGFDQTYGFTGFSGDNAPVSGIVSNLNWIYDGGNTNPSLHNCMYPQLSVFYNSADAFVRAYSYASVSTVHEQVWDKSAYDDTLANTTYDTVRDLTMRFTMTSYIDNTKDVNARISWGKDNTLSTIYPNDTKQVINFFQKTMSSKYGREYWTSDKFAPGIEWVKVNVTLTDANGNEVVGSRRLRIIPTANLTPGKDQIDLVSGGTYNHAKDMYMSYSTAHKMNLNQITTGVYPDALPFEANDPRMAIQTNSTDPTLQSLFALNDDKFRVDGSYMTGEVSNLNDSKPNNVVNTKLYRVSSFAEKDGTVQIKYDKKTDLLLDHGLLQANDPTALSWADKMNGKKVFAKADVGRYLIEYEWIMPDGRFMRDSKLIMVQEGQHDVSLNVLNTVDNSANSKLVSLAIEPYTYTTQVPDLLFTIPSASEVKEVDHFTPVVVGFQNIYDSTTIDKLEFVVTTNDINAQETIQTIAFPQVADGASVDVPTRYVYSSYEENGNYFAKIVETVRTYTLHYDATKNYYYITLDSKFNDNVTGLQRYDVESNMQLKVYVSNEEIKKEGSVKVSNQTFLNMKEVHIADSFVYKIKGPYNYEKEVTLDSLASGNVFEETLPIGEYTISQLKKADGYHLTSVNVDGVEVKDSYTFVISEDKQTSVMLRNEKNVTVDPDPNPDPNPEPKPTPPNNEPSNKEEIKKPSTGNAVDTGDAKWLLIYMLLLLVSGLSIKVFHDRRIDN